MDNVSYIALWSQALNLFMGFIGAAAAYGILRFLDWVNGTKAKDHIAIIDDSPLALAIYRGARFASVLIFVALLLK